MYRNFFLSSFATDGNVGHGLKPEKVKPIFSSVKGAVSRNSAKLGNYKIPFKLRETKK